MSKDYKESVELRRSIVRGGQTHEAGDKIEVYDWEKRQLIASGYVDGNDIDTAPPAVQELYKEAAKGPEKRSDMDVFSVDKFAKEGDGYGSADEGQGHEEQPQKQSKSKS